MAAIKGDRAVVELAQQFDVHPNQITRWKTQLLERAGIVIGGGAERELPPIDLKALHAKIGELTLENDLLEGALTKAGLLSAKRRLTGPTRYRLPDKPRRPAWVGDFTHS